MTYNDVAILSMLYLQDSVSMRVDHALLVNYKVTLHQNNFRNNDVPFLAFHQLTVIAEK